MELLELQERIQRWKQRNASPEEGEGMGTAPDTSEEESEEENQFESQEQERPSDDATGEISTDDIFDEEEVDDDDLLGG